MILFFAPWFDNHTGELLFTRQVVDYAGKALGHRVVSHWLMHGIWDYLANAEQGGSPESVYRAYVVIGQSLMTVVVGLFGGFIGQYFFRSPATQS